MHHYGIGTSDAGGFITEALGGNAISGLADIYLSVTTNNAGEHGPTYTGGQIIAAGPGLGLKPVLPEGVPEGPADKVPRAVIGGAYKVFKQSIGYGEKIQTISGTQTLGWSSTLPTVATVAKGVKVFGNYKLAYDAATFAGALAYCKAAQ